MRGPAADFLQCVVDHWWQIAILAVIATVALLLLLRAVLAPLRPMGDALKKHLTKEFSTSVGRVNFIGIVLVCGLVLYIRSPSLERFFVDGETGQSPSSDVLYVVAVVAAFVASVWAVAWHERFVDHFSGPHPGKTQASPQRKGRGASKAKP